MQIWLIYDRAGLAANQWMADHYVEVGEKHGIPVQIVVAEELVIGEGSQLPDVAVFRSWNQQLHAQLERLGVVCFNPTAVSAIANDKLRTVEWVASLGLPTLKTAPLVNRSAVEEVGGYPVVVKPTGGHGGVGVELIAGPEDWEPYWKDAQLGTFLVQEVASGYVTAGARDVRVYVVGGRILAAMERRAQRSDSGDSAGGARVARGTGPLRANYTLGGSARVYDLDNPGNPEAAEIRAAVEIVVGELEKYGQLGTIGVDFLFHHGHPVIGEIEDIVGARMLYDHTDIDIVEEFMRAFVLSMGV
ncbi:MAG: hypothetical protein SPI77_05180 [Corynebacterium sp.]|nr:hypothetical protein [Corynebacterium sp.]